MLKLLLAGVVVVVAVVVVRYLQAKKTAMDPAVFQPYRFLERIAKSHDTFVFRFALQHADQTLGLPVGHHIEIRAPCRTPEGGEEVVQHAYTPISSDDERGYVDFLIKVYFPNQHPKFPHGGRLSQKLHQLKAGDTVDMRGPRGKFRYLGNGVAQINRPGKELRTEKVDAFAMVAGGTGITPIYQVAMAIHKNKSDPTRVYIVFANQTESDILLRSELDALVKEDSRIHVWYTIDRDVPPLWKYGVGYVSEEMFRARLPVVDLLGDSSVPQNAGLKKVMGLMCGPPPMIQFAVRPNLEKLGYTPDMLFSF